MKAANAKVNEVSGGSAYSGTEHDKEGSHLPTRLRAVVTVMTTNK
jgi:hypothetical protein